MGDRVLQTNQLVNLTLDSAPAGRGLAAIVHDISAEDVRLTLPDPASLPEAFAEGVELHVAVYDQSGMHVGRSRIVATPRTPKWLLSISTPTDFQTTQNRTFYRVAVNVPVVFSVRRSRNPKVAGITREKALSEDISAGGVRFVTTVPLEAGDTVDVELGEAYVESKTDHRVTVRAEVLRAVPLTKDGLGARSVSVEFGELPEATRNKVLRYLFDLQTTTAY